MEGEGTKRMDYRALVLKIDIVQLFAAGIIPIYLGICLWRLFGPKRNPAAPLMRKLMRVAAGGLMLLGVLGLLTQVLG